MHWRAWRTVPIVSLVFALSFAARPATGSDEGSSYALRWHRGDSAESCIDERTLASRVDERLGRSAFVASPAAELTIDASIARTASGWSAKIAVRDRAGHSRGQRDLASTEQDCRTLDRALALMLALTIDPRAAAEGGAHGADADASDRRAPVPAPPVASPPPLEASSSHPSAETSVPEAGSKAHIEAGPRLVFGPLPSAPAVGAHAHAVLPIAGSWSVRVGMSSWVPASVTADRWSANFQLLTASLAVCQHRRATNAFALFCTGFEPGRLAQRGLGFSARNRDGADLVFMLTAGARGALRVAGPIWVQVGGDLLVPLVRDQFYHLQSDGTESDVFRAAMIGASADASLLFTFP